VRKEEKKNHSTSEILRGRGKKNRPFPEDLCRPFWEEGVFYQKKVGSSRCSVGGIIIVTAEGIKGIWLTVSFP